MRRIDRPLLLVTVLAACVVVPRAALVSRALNEGVDDDWHLRRGLVFWSGEDVNLRLNDPVFGAAIAALPLVALDCTSREPINPQTVPPPELVPFGPRAGMENAALSDELRAKARAGRRHVLYGQRLMPETLFLVVGLWKALLFVPLISLSFAWCRKLYGQPAGWLAAAVLTFEPNFAAMIHMPGVDVLAVEAIVFACFSAWRYANTRAPGWLVATVAATALAMSIKHTALILPFVLLMYLFLDAWMRGRPMRSVQVWRSRARWAALAAVVWAAMVWAMTGFDVSIPNEVGGDYNRPPPQAAAWRRALAHVVEVQLTRPLPAGAYVGAVFAGLQHNHVGHWSYLFGEQRLRGWWYYFPVVASYKVPIGILALLALAVASVWWIKPRLAELALFVALLGYTALLFTTTINIGFRHALPAYTFALLLASRVASRPVPRWSAAMAWVAVGSASLHGMAYHPNYHAYLNLPRPLPHLDINDSNLDWGQAIKPIAPWLEDNRSWIGGRTVWLRCFGDDAGVVAAWHLGDRVTRLELESTRPTSGVLIVSPIHAAGLYDASQPYAALGTVTPDAVIADTMLVYDMDRLGAEGFTWPKRVSGRQPFSDLR